MSRTFQHVRLLPTMSVLENVAIGAHMRRQRRRARRPWRMDRAEEARLLAEARARSSASVWASTCSTRRPAALRSGPAAHPRDRARCASDPCLLLLDEPAAGLRYKEKEALGDLLRPASEGMACCWSSTTWTS